MSQAIKNKQQILEKLGIEQLNPMQVEAQTAIHSNRDVCILSPTGTGKTLAFLLPILSELKPNCTEIQILILVPSRELAIQIEQVIRNMGTGFKANAVYGGRTLAKDKTEISHIPDILIGTPGRIAHHIRKETFTVQEVHTLVLDEFDKSLEVGFAEDMKAILYELRNLRKKVLTSATASESYPPFVGMEGAATVDHLDTKIQELEIKIALTDQKDKLQGLVQLLGHMGNKPGIIFCNFKESISRVSDFLKEKNVAHGCFYGGMEQRDRERALIKFRNGTHQLIIATDLAARGLDIPEIQYIIHYHLPNRSQEFTHRNGRTARMHSKGTAYVLHFTAEKLPDFIAELNAPEVSITSLSKSNETGNKKVEKIEEKKGEGKNEDATNQEITEWTTLFISGGRKDKISKGDIAGLFFKQGNLEKNELGHIELKQDCAFVAIASNKAQQLIDIVNNTRLKKKKVRVHIV